VASNDKIIAAQKKILASLVVWETRIGDLYDVYAKLYPKSRMMWQSLAGEERQHATLLRSFTKELDEGRLFWNIGLFTEEMVETRVSAVNAALEAVLANELSERELVETAVEIESSLLESKFYSVVTSESPSFSHIATALTKATDRHLEKLKVMIQGHAGDMDWKV
jgi:hypothetical protein